MRGSGGKEEVNWLWLEENIQQTELRSSLRWEGALRTELVYFWRGSTQKRDLQNSKSLLDPRIIKLKHKISFENHKFTLSPYLVFVSLVYEYAECELLNQKRRNIYFAVDPWIMSQKKLTIFKRFLLDRYTFMTSCDRLLVNLFKHLVTNAVFQVPHYLFKFLWFLYHFWYSNHNDQFISFSCPFLQKINLFLLKKFLRESDPLPVQIIEQRENLHFLSTNRFKTERVKSIDCVFACRNADWVADRIWNFLRHL